MFRQLRMTSSDDDPARPVQGDKAVDAHSSDNEQSEPPLPEIGSTDSEEEAKNEKKPVTKSDKSDEADAKVDVSDQSIPSDLSDQLLNMGRDEPKAKPEQKQPPKSHDSPQTSSDEARVANNRQVRVDVVQGHADIIDEEESDFDIDGLLRRVSEGETFAQDVDMGPDSDDERVDEILAKLNL